MRTITLHEVGGEDGILRLQLPAEPRGARVEVVVVIQTEPNGNGPAKRSSVMDFAGILTDETFEIPEELPFETNRLPFE